ncbi:hypothetical protein [Janthinobacterium sp. PAMC25594]|uniref:hypothetical protein n=1 Tax=Janthinobacterium sp. PAMC25594 TaxID=2861284 RepID=UPI001C626CAE|nr:hypothetical protein [Janthinobacterium sp. PAMC25594]QYG08933.1 hypothetical protein KY494_09405 [Janthinobacterium sp. PAMC25594]
MGFYNDGCDDYDDRSYITAPDNSTGGSGSYVTVGYVEPVLGPVGVGASVTVTSRGDVLVSGVVSTAGPIAVAGTTPAGVAPADYLTGGAVSGNLPNGVGATIGIPTNASTAQPTYGTAGAGVSYTVQPTQVYNSFVNSVINGVTNIVNQAVNYGNNAMGVPAH